MPKKFAGENSKAVAARTRKAAAKDDETVRKQKQIEEEHWKDENKHLARKQQKKDEQDRKKQENMDRKAEAKALLEQEMSAIKKATKVVAPSKVTRAQIADITTTAPKKEKVIETHLDVPLEENVNRLVIDGEEARTVTEAIAVLSSKEAAADKHPEKRMKAAYAAYEERRLSVLKEENPSLRLTQLKQMIFKEWQKSPENPLNSN